LKKHYWLVSRQISRWKFLILIFDENTVQDVSTFEKPHAYSKGFKYVIVNGKVVVENENHNGTRSGEALYGSDRIL
jgi:N-acyl-D-amino-acid deacylase